MPKYDWLLSDYREPAPSQPADIPRIHMRRQLTAILPGCSKRVNGVRIERTAAHDKYECKIDGRKMNLEQAIDNMLRRERKPKPARIEVAPAPRVFPSAIDYSAPIATIQVDLFAALVS